MTGTIYDLAYDVRANLTSAIETLKAGYADLDQLNEDQRRAASLIDCAVIALDVTAEKAEKLETAIFAL